MSMSMPMPMPMPSPQQTSCRSRCGSKRAALAVRGASGAPGSGRNWNEARMERYLVQ
jgi:hypothetical protein